jgi:L-cystine uptake protein TcyP (sodium:dicarboxylate symporter family)
MARTALNVNGSIAAGIITSKFLGSKDADGVLAESDV